MSSLLKARKEQEAIKPSHIGIVKKTQQLNATREPELDLGTEEEHYYRNWRNWKVYSSTNSIIPMLIF